MPREGYRASIERSITEMDPKQYDKYYPVQLRAQDGSSAVLQLPFQDLPGGDKAIALLMTTQCDHEVIDGINDLLTANIKDIHPDVMVGLPALGLPLAEGVARRLDHNSYVPLSNSVKFWQDNNFIVPVSSITSGGGKSLCLDQHLLSRVFGKIVVIQDDVANTGKSLAAAHELVKKAGAKEIFISVVMTEGHAWESVLEEVGFDWKSNLRTLGHIPMFSRHSEKSWIPIPETE